MSTQTENKPVNTFIQFTKTKHGAAVVSKHLQDIMRSFNGAFKVNIVKHRPLLEAYLRE